MVKPPSIMSVANAAAMRLLASPHMPNEIIPSADGSHVFNYGTYDTVLFPPGRKGGSTVCVSVQKGCSLKPGENVCRFCSTGRYVNFRGSLTGEEIASQVMVAAREIPDRKNILRVLFAGMGDSSYNPEGVVDAIGILGAAYPEDARHFFITTIGSPISALNGLKERLLTAFAEGAIAEGTSVFLQISLHASTDSKRSFLIPASGRDPVRNILGGAIKFRDDLLPYVPPMLRSPDYPEKPMVTLNYLMLGPRENNFPGNATDGDMGALVQLLESYGADNFLVQLCGYNPDRRDGSHTFGEIPEETFTRWVSTLRDSGIRVKRFMSKGVDVRGGCGQLTGDGSTRPTTKPQ